MSSGDKTEQPDAYVDAFTKRRTGSARNGSVFIREFDRGVVLTLGAKIGEDLDGNPNYYVSVPNVSPSPQLPGIPVTFAFPEGVYEKHIIPTFVVRRDDIVAAPSRWHPGNTQYEAPIESSLPVSVTVPGVGIVNGYDRVEVRKQAEPVDILYTISVIGRHRQGIGGRSETNEMLRWVLSRFNTYRALRVYDDAGDLRTYEVFREGISSLDRVVEVTDRLMGFAVSLRVEGELDIHEPDVCGKVTKLPSLDPQGTITVNID